MNTETLILVKREYDLLTKHLKASNLSDYNKDRLQKELKSAVIVREDALPHDTVRMDSEVEIKEIGKNESFTIQIVMPAEANILKKRVSVFSPIAIAILGYRTNSKVQWEMPNGVKTFEILNVKLKGHDEA